MTSTPPPPPKKIKIFQIPAPTPRNRQKYSADHVCKYAKSTPWVKLANTLLEYSRESVS